MTKLLNKLYIGENGKAVEVIPPPPEVILVGNRYDTSMPAMLRVWQEATKYPDGTLWLRGQVRTSKVSLFTDNFIMPVYNGGLISAIPIWPTDEVPGGINTFGMWFLQAMTKSYVTINIAAGLVLDQTWQWQVKGRWKE